MLHALLLTTHVVAGVAGLLLGAMAMAAPKRARWHPRIGIAYQASAAAMTSTAVGLVAMAPHRLWWLGVIALVTEAAALGGWWMRRAHPRGWLAWHIRLMCGSYVSFLTAALVVNVDSPLAWILPTVIATPLIALAVKRSTAPHAGARRAMSQ